MPLAGQFCTTAPQAKEAARFPLTWVRCATCTLVQVSEDIPDDLLYSNYNYASSSVGPLVAHFKDYAAVLAAEYGTKTATNILEIGCNDGVLLNQLPSSWVRYGVDPSDVARRAGGANSGTYTLVDQPFCMETVEENGLMKRFDVVTGSNCLAHISDLAGVFEAAHAALKPEGHFWVEVHDLHALLDTQQWDTIYHEHKVEWSLESLQLCTALARFSLKKIQRIPIHGGSLRCCFEKQSAPSDTIVFDPPTTPHSFQDLREAFTQRYETAAVHSFNRVLARGGRIAAYGASGRANVYLNQLSDIPFSYIVDEADLRLGKFLPCVAVPIVSPLSLREDPVEICLVTAWNYKEAIISKNAAFSGKWLTAFSDSCASAS